MFQYTHFFYLDYGDFDVEINQDIGMFNSLGTEFTNIKNGFEKAVNEEVKSTRSTLTKFNLIFPLLALLTSNRSWIRFFNLSEFRSSVSADEIKVSEDELVERFIQGDTSRNTSGSGLGLAIAKSFTELQNGIFKVNVDGEIIRNSSRCFRN